MTDNSENPTEVTTEVQSPETPEVSDTKLHDRRGFNKTLATIIGAAGIGLVAAEANAQTPAKSRIVDRIKQQMERHSVEPVDDAGGDAALYGKTSHSNYLKA
jgi:hypothetical protein